MTDALTIAECGRLFGVTHRTLRFYEQKELLAPQRTGKVRLYDGEQQARLAVIREAAAAGLDLETIRDGLRSDDEGAWLDLPASVWDANATRQVAELTAATRRADLAESLARNRELRRRANVVRRAA